MATTLAGPIVSRHRELAETDLRMAKASLRKAEMSWPEQIGRAVQRAVSLVGWSLKEFAAAVDHDPRQCARWLAGTERPQFDVLFSVEALRTALVIALAEMIGDGVEVRTEISIKRIA